MTWHENSHVCIFFTHLCILQSKNFSFFLSCRLLSFIITLPSPTTQRLPSTTNTMTRHEICCLGMSFFRSFNYITNKNIFFLFVGHHPLWPTQHCDMKIHGMSLFHSFIYFTDKNFFFFSCRLTFVQPPATHATCHEHSHSGTLISLIDNFLNAKPDRHFCHT